MTAQKLQARTMFLTRELSAGRALMPMMLG
jgi:hypothetical protein